MRDLLLNKGLLTSKQGAEIRVIALTETLSAMRQLDPKRNSFLIRFLQNAHLNGEDPSTRASYNIVNFLGADLSDIDFSGANLTGAILTGANLTDANLADANLNRTYLYGANLSRADLTNGVEIVEKLTNADLDKANFTNAQDITQQQLDQVYTCKDASLPPGLTCHHNQ